jgi:integrase
MICGLIQRGGVFYGKLRLKNWEQECRRSLDTTDRQVAWARLLEWRRDEEWEDVGLLPPRKLREARKKPLAGLVEAFLGDMQARQKSPGSIHKYGVAMRKLSRECKWETLGDVSAASFCEWRQDCGLRPKTSNDYLHVARRFFRWLKRQQMVKNNPLKYVDLADVRAVEREYRRALTTDEVFRLLDSTPWPRRIVYRMALETGLRPRELRRLCWSHLALDPAPAGGAQRSDVSANANAQSKREGSPPSGAGEGAWGPPAVVRVPASLAKGRKTTVMPLGPVLAAELRALRSPDDAPFSPVFYRMVPKPAHFRADLAKAGISFLDDQDRRVDLHALRKTYGTALVLNGESPRVVMEAMRHCDLKLTMKTYTDASQLPVGAALHRLPWSERPAVQRSAGTA